MKLFRVGTDEKCGCCNWRVYALYLMADSQEQANAEYKEQADPDLGREGSGLCGDCIAELLLGRYDITAPKP